MLGDAKKQSEEILMRMEAASRFSRRAELARLQVPQPQYQQRGGTANSMLSRSLVCALAGLALLACSGCYPLPVRFPTRTTDTSADPIDLRFLKAGSTTRDEVAAKLSRIATNVTQEDFFWGRLRVSKYREVIMIGYVPLAPGNRMWGVQNLLVGYDQHGLVKNWTMLGDGKLLEQLDLMDDAANSPLDLTSPVVVNSGFPQLTVGPDSLECFGVRIARSELRTIALTNSGESDSLSLRMFFRHQIDFSKTLLKKRTDQIDLFVDAHTLLFLRRYMKQSARVN